MFDFAFDWRNELETNIEVLDQQHKEFFRIGRDIEQLLVIRCIGVTQQQLLDIICELREFVSYHFYTEETLMKKAGYEGYEFHANAHAQFFKQVQSIDMPALAKNPYKELKKIKDMIQDWIFAHQFDNDFQMADAIRRKLEQKEVRV